MQLGPYTVIEEIARGGMGVVYRGRAADGTEVALKLILPQQSADPRTRQRFEAEIQALARLQHPGIVPILGAGDHQGAPWLALEFVAGDSLETRLRHGPLPIREAIDVAHQLAQALSYVHACGLLHRDVTPSNVLLDEGRARLTDFGLVLDDQSASARLTTSGVFQGTPGYWSPEQAQGNPQACGPQTDVYGLGAVLYACLSGVPPVDASSLQAALEPARFTSIAPVRSLRPEAPPWLDELCMNCLAESPAGRPDSAEAVARALMLEDTRPTATDQGSARRRLLAAGVALALLGLALGLGLWATSRPTAPAPPPQRASPDRARSDTLVREGLALYRAGDYLRGIEVLDRAVLADPTHATAYSNRAACLEALERHTEALCDLDLAVTLEPRNPVTFTNRAATYTSLRRYRDAVADCDRALALNSRIAAAYTNRGLANTGLEEFEAAIKDFDRGIALNPRLAIAYSHRSQAKALAGDFEGAIHDLDQQLELDPNDALAYAERGLFKSRIKRYPSALEDLNEALRRDPRNATTLRNRGTTLLNLARYQAAIDDYDRVLELEPTNAIAYRNRGTCKQQLARHDEALADYARALELQPDHAPTLSLQGDSHAAKGDLAAALEDYDRALRGDPRLSSAYLGRGFTKAKLGEFPAALADLDRALELGVSPELANGIASLRAKIQAELQR